MPRITWTNVFRRGVAGFWITAALVLLMPSSSFGQTHRWSGGFGDTNTDWGYDTVLLADGSMVVTGGFQGTVNFGGGPLVSAGGFDIFLAKYDALGNHEWSFRYGAGGSDLGQSVGLDSAGNILFTGSFSDTVDFGGGDLMSSGSGDVILAKFDPNGGHIWSQRFGSGSSDSGKSLVVDGNDNVIITGTYVSAVDFGGGVLPVGSSFESFIASYDTDGNYIWSKGIAAFGNDDGFDVDVDASDNVIATGRFSSSYDFGGGVVTNNGSSDIYVAKYTNVGGFVWANGFGGGSADTGQDVVVDPAGNVYVTGTFATSVDFGGGLITSAGSSDIFLLKLAPGGAHTWSYGYGDTGSDSGLSLDLDSGGDVWLTGFFSTSADLGGGVLSGTSSETYIARYTSDGAHVSSVNFGGTSSDQARSLDVRHGSLAIIGDNSGTIDFGGGSIMTAGASDVSIAKFEIDESPAVIQSIVDVGNDQGKQVRITFSASSRDEQGSSTPVTQYAAFRRIDPLPAGAPPADVELPQRAEAGTMIEGWEYVGAIPAFGELTYSMIAPTLADSTDADGMHWSVFFIRAATAVPTEYFDSDPDSGYSLDNLAPQAPMNLALATSVLTWDDVPDADFNYYTVYGSSTPDFGTAAVIGSTIDSELDVQASPFFYYFVTATDFSGNEGDPGTLDAVSGVAASTPTYRLAVSASPNPFNPATTITYTVPENGPVWVAVYDVAGRLVDELMSGVERPAGVHRLPYRPDQASGVYFVRVRTAVESRTARVVLLK